MFKKRERPSSARARDETGEGDGEAGSVPKGEKRSRHSSAASSAGDGENWSIIASTRKNEAELAAAKADKNEDNALSGFAADSKMSMRPADDAVRRVEVDTDKAHDTRAVLERNQAIHKGLKDGSLEKGVYRGLGAYKQYAERGEGAIANSKYSGQLGPVRSGSNVRSTLRIEFIGTTGEGGICKDYKETGYCGFGDSCKFLHDRSDYKPSYILEKEWDEKQKAIQDRKIKRWERRMARKTSAAGTGAGDDSPIDGDASSTGEEDEEELPSACPDCHTNWEECQSVPVRTVCNHYFCEDCALRNFATNPKCLTCDVPTNGIFNSCDALEEKIKQKKAAKKAKKDKSGTGREERAAYDIGLEE